MLRNTESEVLRLAIVILRGLRAWSQSEFAKAADTSPSVISEYESGKRNPTRRAVERMAEAVGVPPSFLEALVPALRSLVEAGEVPSAVAVSLARGQALTKGIWGRLGSLLRFTSRLVDPFSRLLF